MVHSGAGLGTGYKRFKYCIRGLATASATADWLRFLDQPALAPVRRHNPNLFHKLQRPYLVRSYHTRRRLETLRHHYEFELNHLPAGLIREIHSLPGRSLAVLPAAGTEDYELRLGFSRMDKEGELTVGLQHRDTGANFFVLTFSLARGAGGRSEIIIGGLQGNKRTNNRELVVSLTRAWHGLRPKALLLFTVQELAAVWGVDSVRAVGNEMHIYRHWRKQKHVESDYDEWWIEAGGRVAGDGLFDLPARFEPRDIASLKVNKRQMYRRRYQMLESLGEQIKASLGGAPAAQTAVCPVTALKPALAA